MDKLLNFQLGWFNKERVVLLVGIAAILVGLFMFLAGGRMPHEPTKIVHYAKEAAFDNQPLNAFNPGALEKIAWTTSRGIFVLLDAPQLAIDAPTPPSINAAVVLPPPFPQPSSKGNNRKGGAE